MLVGQEKTHTIYEGLDYPVARGKGKGADGGKGRHGPGAFRKQMRKERELKGGETSQAFSRQMRAPRSWNFFSKAS